jgi:hypothetical protein
MFSKNRKKIINIFVAVIAGLIVAGFWSFANPIQKTSITAPIEAGLVGYWNMDDNDIFSSTLYDKSGSGNDGTIYGATSGVNGKIKQALSFDGTDDYVEVTDNSSLDITDAITLSAWVEAAYNNSSFLADTFDDESKIFSKENITVNSGQATLETLKSNGESCSSGSECESTYCVDDVCCDSDCNGTCKTCSGDDGGTAGTCHNTNAAYDLDNECTDFNNCAVTGNSASDINCTTKCSTYTKNSGLCNGSGACAANQSCACSSIGTDAGGGNGLYNKSVWNGIIKDCVNSTEAGSCATVMISNSCGGYSTNCNCQ